VDKSKKSARRQKGISFVIFNGQLGKEGFGNRNHTAPMDGLYAWKAKGSFLPSERKNEEQNPLEFDICPVFPDSGAGFFQTWRCFFAGMNSPPIPLFRNSENLLLYDIGSIFLAKLKQTGGLHVQNP
jgi:hypothetical protein